MPYGQYIPISPDSVRVYTNAQPVFENFVLSGNGYDLNFSGAVLTKSGKLGNIFAPPPMISWRKSKNFVITQIDGADAEVVERYGDNSWEISMQGLLVDTENHQFPLDKMQQLRKAFEVADSFEVSGQLFDSLGISSIYFTEVNFAGMQGYQDTVSYTLQSRSIKPVEFYLNGEQ